MSATTTIEEWDRRFMRLAEEVATWSKDPQRKIGSVVVAPSRRQVAVGYNGFPPSIPDFPDVLADPQWKNRIIIHAERNALDNALFDTFGATLYVTHFPCVDCVKGMLAKRIARVVCPRRPIRESKWADSWEQAGKLLLYAKVPLIHPFD